MDERMKNLVIGACEDAAGGDTFGERAENYYQKRPQLIALLKDLYNGYTTLLNRCESMKRKVNINSSLDHHQDELDFSEITSLHFDSDMESSNSYPHQIDHQTPIPSRVQSQNSVSFEKDFGSNSTLSTLEKDFGSDSTSKYSSMSEGCISPIKGEQDPEPVRCEILTVSDMEEVVAELVGKTVENGVLSDQLGNVEQICNESGRKIDLLKNLVEILESERMILLNENTNLGYRVGTLLEENRVLAAEAVFMKRKAAELARCALRLREDHRVCLLSRKIEDLQGQIYGLEKRNREYYQMLMSTNVGGGDCGGDGEKKNGALVVGTEMKGKSNNGGGDGGGCGGGSFGVFFKMEKIYKAPMKKKRDDDAAAAIVVADVNNGGKKWWGKVMKMDVFMCGLHST